jgi:hypothetical protein
MPLQLVMDVPLGFGPGGGFVAPKGTVQVWIRDKIDGYQGLKLDGNFFLGNEIRNCTLIYNGGQSVFDLSNKVIDSRLQIFPPESGPNGAFGRYLIENFPWSQCIPVPCSQLR